MKGLDHDFNVGDFIRQHEFAASVQVTTWNWSLGGVAVIDSGICCSGNNCEESGDVAPLVHHFHQAFDWATWNGSPFDLDGHSSEDDTRSLRKTLLGGSQK